MRKLKQSSKTSQDTQVHGQMASQGEFYQMFLFKKDFIYLFMIDTHTHREREREAEAQAEGGAGSMQGV